MCKQLIHHFRKLPRVLRGAEMVGWSFYLVLRRLHAVRFQQCCSNCTAIHSLPPRSNKLVCDIKLDVCRSKTNWKRRLRDTSAVSPLFPLILAVSEKRITTGHIIIQTSERHFLVSWSFCVLYHHWFTTHLSSFTKHFWLWSWRLFSRQPETLQDIYPALLILSLLVGMPIFNSLSLCEISIF